MWMCVLSGEHVSSDTALVKGEVRWWRHSIAAPLAHGTFDHWTILAERKPELERYAGGWIRRHLKGYTGMLNLETVGGRIIEAHLRFADQWPDLYGAGWVESVVELYAHGRWNYADSDRGTGYSVVLFGPHGVRYRRPDAEFERDLRADRDVSSVQFTFFEGMPPRQHAMPPGGFRLAIVNCWRLEAGLAARERLALHFWATQRIEPHRRRADRLHAHR